MKNITLFLSIAASVVALAGEPAPKPSFYSDKTLADMVKLQEAALASDYAYRQTGHLTNNIGPRLTGSPQAKKAVDYVADEMRKLGLDVRLQEVTVPHWVRGVETGEIVEFPGMAPDTTQKIVLTALGGSIATPAEGITAEVVVVRNFEELTALGRNKIAGKIVLFNNKFDVDLQNSGYGGPAYFKAVQYRGGGAVAAARLGGILALARSAGGSQNRLAHTGAMHYDADVPKIPAAAVSYEDAETLAHLAKEGKVRVHITLTPQTLPATQSYNVIGDLKGSVKPEEVVIVSGHLDSWDLGTGALDDACGVAVSMEVAHLVKKLKLKPKRTIRVIAFMNEENGQAGANKYFEENKDKLLKHFAAIESDNGASHSLGFIFSGKKEALPLFDPIAKILQSQGAPMVDYHEGEVGTDIDPLTESGVPSFAPKVDTRTYFNYHHTAADTFDKIHPKELAELGSVMTVLAYGLANLEQDLPR